MRYRLAPLLAALALLLAACGDDEKHAGDTRDDTTTTTDDEPGSTAVTTAPRPPAKASGIAIVMVQLDDQLRRVHADATACIDGPHELCAGRPLEAYEHDLDVISKNMVEVLPKLADESSELYQGRFSADLAARLDATVNLGATFRAAHAAALAACVPAFDAACQDANESLDLAIGEVLKDLSTWRDDYDPALDPTQDPGAGTDDASS